MQSLRPFPPPPGALGAASAGLALEEDKAAVSVLAEPPEVRVVVVVAGDSGAMADACGAGAPIIAAGVAAGGAGGTGMVNAALMLEAGTAVVAAEVVGLVAAGTVTANGLNVEERVGAGEAGLIAPRASRPWPPPAEAVPCMANEVSAATSAIDQDFLMSMTLRVSRSHAAHVK